MEPIRIGGNANKDEVKDIIDRYFFNSRVEIEEKNFEDRFEFFFSLGKKKPLEEITFYNSLANLVLDIIIEIYIKQVIKDRVVKICSDYSIAEKEDIIIASHGILIDTNCYIKEKDKIKEQISDYLIEHNSLLIDGYMKFRLKDYLYTVDISIEKAIINLETEKEYLEFLNMLQYFVDIQEPKFELINVIIQDNDYFILDVDNNIIEDGLLNDMVNELPYEDISKSDLLISSLIVISPNKLVVHIEDKEKGKEVINILNEIFRDKVSYCSGCESCKVNVKLKKGK